MRSLWKDERFKNGLILERQMFARELILDSPKLDVLLDRCLSNDYSVDEFDCFYMQGVSERDKLQVPDFNPADGHWYGASVIVAGGLLQAAFRQAKYGDNALKANREIIRANVQHEIQTLQGNPTRKGDLFSYDEIKELYRRLAAAAKGREPTALYLEKGVRESFARQVQKFYELCERRSDEVYDQVDVDSPVFANTKLFLPLKEKRKFTEEELLRLNSAYLHDLYPFTAHLMYCYFLKRFGL